MNLLTMSVSGGILICIILLLRKLTLYKLPKTTFLVLWVVALCRLLIPFSIPSQFSFYTVLNDLEGDQIVVQVPDHTEVNLDETEIIPEAEEAESMEEPLPWEDSQTVEPLPVPNQTSARPTSVWMVLYVTGAAVCALFFLVQYTYWIRRFRTALPVACPAVEAWRRQYPNVQVMESDQICAPLTYGLFRPVVLLPKGTDWTDEEGLSYVLAHEGVHIRRKDLWMKLALAAAVCVHWFNPLVWIMVRQANQDIELACDEWVLHTLGEERKESYARALIRWEEKKRNLLPLCSSAGGSSMEQRIRSIMKTRRRSVAVVAAALLAIVAITAVFVTSGKQGEVAEGESGPQIQTDSALRREDTYTFLVLGNDQTGRNTDTILLVCYDVPNQKLGVLSIPRDMAVEGEQGYLRMGQVYGKYGVDGAEEIIQNTFGIPIDYSVCLDTEVFAELVDAVGGVDVNIPVDMDYDDPYQDLHIHLSSGMQHLDGQAAMGAVRYRKNNDLTTDYDDMDRARFQREMIAALGKKVLSWESLDKVTQLAEIVQSKITTDLSAQDMLYFASNAIKLDVEQGLSMGELGDFTIVQSDQGYLVMAYEAEQILPILNQLVNPYLEPLTTEDLDLPKIFYDEAGEFPASLLPPGESSDSSANRMPEDTTKELPPAQTMTEKTPARSSTYPVNSQGQTYGVWTEADGYGDVPDLIYYQQDEATTGYVKRTDYCPVTGLPETEAEIRQYLTWYEKFGRTTLRNAEAHIWGIPVYDQEGRETGENCQVYITECSLTEEQLREQLKAGTVIRPALMQCSAPAENIPEGRRIYSTNALLDEPSEEQKALLAKYTEHGDWKRNSQGETYGDDRISGYVGYTPDWVAVTASNGKQGYITYEDETWHGYPEAETGEAEFASYLRWVENQPAILAVPVYDLNGTVIGMYEAQVNSSGKDLNVPKETLLASVGEILTRRGMPQEEVDRALTVM